MTDDNTRIPENAPNVDNAPAIDGGTIAATGEAAGPVDASGTGAPGDAPPPGRKRWVVAAMAALAIAFFTVPFLQGPDAPAPAPGVASSEARNGATAAAGTCPEPEGAANFNFTLKDMNGANVRLSDYKGKVVLLNFWATWCGPCKVEIPEFVEVYSQYRSRGFEILGVLSQDEPSSDDLHKFASGFKMNYPVFRANEDFENAHGPIWALPTTYIIDRTGAICRKHMGPVSRDTVEREIKGLL
jgi:peroxiredoxin